MKAVVVALLCHIGIGLASGEEFIQRVPSEPRELEVIALNATAARLSWRPPKELKGQLLGYYVYKEQLERNTHEPVMGTYHKVKMMQDPAATSTVITGLRPDTPYAIRVNAFNQNGDGSFSDTRILETKGLPPSPPKAVSAVVIDGQDAAPFAIRVAWLPPATRPGQPVQGYVVKYKAADDTEYSTKHTDKTQVDIKGFLAGKEYEFVVWAKNADGNSPNETAMVRTPDARPDGPPTELSYKYRSDGALEVIWDAPAAERRNGRIVAYKAILAPDAGGKPLEKIIQDSRRAVFQGLPSGERYEFTVAAKTSQGYGPPSQALMVGPNKQTLIPAPSKVHVQALSESSAVVTWVPVIDVDINSYMVRYTDQVGVSNTDQWTQVKVDGLDNSAILDGLRPDVPYAFCVASVRRDGRTGDCTDKPYTLARLEPAHLVKNLRVAWVTHDTAKLNWDYHGQQPVKFYVNYSGVKSFLRADGTWEHLPRFGAAGGEKLLEGAQTTLVESDLRPNAKYTFKVGVKTERRRYWPAEVQLHTRYKYPPFVEAPEHVGRVENMVKLRLKPAAEEDGPLSHYWLVVVSKNETFRRPSDFTESMLRSENNGPAGWWIAANISASEMRQRKTPFHVGSGRSSDGLYDYPLSAANTYKAFVRAFVAKQPGGDHRRPPQGTAELLSRSKTDSQYSVPFHVRRKPPYTKAGGQPGAGTGAVGSGPQSQGWIAGPIIACVVVALILALLLVYWLKRNRGKKQPAGVVRHGSISKVQLGPSPNETSKLLLDGYAGNALISPYEPLVAGGGAMQQSQQHAMGPPPPADGHSMAMHDAMGMHQAGGTGPPSSHVYPVPGAPGGPGSAAAASVAGASTSALAAHPPIPITELAAHIERLKANDNLLFFQEYESIETGQQFTWEHSNLDANKAKNRYANVVAYDHSRVILSPLEGVPCSDYINANYVDGYRKPKAYIATQGAMPETFADFWRMVWEEQSVSIVMLTKLEERSRIKCDQYWPTRGTNTYGLISVTIADTLDLAHYTIRTFQIQRRGESEVREIRHLQFTAWPDHGVPEHPTPFLMFLKRVKSLNPPEAGPIVCHCSAGIGRTGAFIAIDCMLDRLRYENTVDMYGCVTALRSQRSYMVQTEDQYVFMHDAVLDAVQSGSTEVPAGKLYTHIQALMQIQPLDNASGMQLEFRHLAALKMSNARFSAGNLPANKNKNRLVNVVPYDSNRVVVGAVPPGGTTDGPGTGGDYVNASWVDGYRRARSYIATQAPLAHTADDFWHMMWQYDSCIVVMLTKLRELGREKCHEYWPAERAARYGHLVVEPIADYNMPQYVVREFKLTDTVSGQSRTVRHFQYTEWPEQGAPKSGELFVEFVGQVHKTKEQFGLDGPCTVHCSTGVGRTGVFITLSIVLERMRYENVVDIFTTVKLLRTQRPNMVQSEDQYHFCYQAALEYLGSFDHYALQCD